MRIGEQDISIKGKKVKAKVTIKEDGDRELLKALYSDWKKLNDRLKEICTTDGYTAYEDAVKSNFGFSCVVRHV